MTEFCLRFHDLTLGYCGHAAVHHLSGDVAKGSLMAVVGANGSGKSTLLKGVAGLLSPLSGSVSGNYARLAYLPQLSELDRSFPARVIDLVSLGLWQRRGLLGRVGRKDRSELATCLGRVGLSGFENRSLDSLSGGQFQRALFARTMLQDADLILLDEPFNAIDTRTVSDLAEIIWQWSTEGRTVLCVLHDLELVRRRFARTILLARSLVAWGETADVLIEENLAKARRFDEPWDERADWCMDQSVAPAQANSPGSGATVVRHAAHV